MEESLVRAAKSRYGAEMDIRVRIDRGIANPLSGLIYHGRGDFSFSVIACAPILVDPHESLRVIHSFLKLLFQQGIGNRKIKRHVFVPTGTGSPALGGTPARILSRHGAHIRAPEPAEHPGAHTVRR